MQVFDDVAQRRLDTEDRKLVFSLAPLSAIEGHVPTDLTPCRSKEVGDGIPYGRR